MNSSMAGTGLVKMRQGVEENPGEDAEDDGGDAERREPSVQTRLLIQVRLVLALEGTTEEKQGCLVTLVAVGLLESGSDRFMLPVSLFCFSAGWIKGNSNGESSTK